MTKYKLEDLKVGAVFKSSHSTRTIITVGKIDVFYFYHSKYSYAEAICRISEFLSGERGDLVKPTKKIAYVEFWNSHDLSSKKICLKQIWGNRISTKPNKFIREFEIEVGEDGFPIEGGV